MNPLLILFILNIFLITSHSIFIMYKYKPYLTSKLQGKSIWDKTYDWLRLLSNVTFIFIPFFLLQWIRDYNSNNHVFNVSALIVLVILNIIFLQISKQFIWSEKFRHVSDDKGKTKLECYFNENKFESTIELLVTNQILNVDKKWIADRRKHKKKYIPVLIGKLVNEKIISYNDYKNIHPFIEEYFGVLYDYSNSTSIIKCILEMDFPDEDLLEYYNNLSFLDSINKNIKIV